MNRTTRTGTQYNDLEVKDKNREVMTTTRTEGKTDEPREKQ